MLKLRFHRSVVLPRDTIYPGSTVTPQGVVYRTHCAGLPEIRSEITVELISRSKCPFRSITTGNNSKFRNTGTAEKGQRYLLSVTVMLAG